jgi:hypothetical protein
MNRERWTTLLRRVTRDCAADIDDLLAEFDPRQDPVGSDVFPEIPGELMPQVALKRPDAICVGVRIATAPADPADQALRLVGFAIEKDVEIVLLAQVDQTGFEPFGFRIERIAGEGAAAEACERQLCRFWNIDMVL